MYVAYHKDTHVTFDEMNQVMNDKRHYFPGYVLQEVIDSSQHYEKFLATDLQTPPHRYVIKALTKAIALTNEVRQVFEAACHAHARIQLPGIYPVHDISGVRQMDNPGYRCRDCTGNRKGLIIDD